MIDPKPQLSTAAIKSNIEYYESICRRHREGYKLARKDLIKWQKQLAQTQSPAVA